MKCLKDSLVKFTCLKEVNEMLLGVMSRIYGADYRMAPPTHTSNLGRGKPSNLVGTKFQMIRPQSCLSDYLSGLIS